MTTKMWAVVTTGNGGYDKLDYRQEPIPVPQEGEVLLKVLAAGVNNTEGSQAGTSTSLGRRTQPLVSKNSRYFSRSSSVFILLGSFRCVEN